MSEATHGAAHSDAPSLTLKAAYAAIDPIVNRVAMDQRPMLLRGLNNRYGVLDGGEWITLQDIIRFVGSDNYIAARRLWRALLLYGQKNDMLIVTGSDVPWCQHFTNDSTLALKARISKESFLANADAFIAAGHKNVGDTRKKLLYDFVQFLR